MKILFKRLTPFRAMNRVALFALVGFVTWSAQAQYTIQYGLYGTPTPFVPHAPTTGYSVDPTGTNYINGTHGFVVHHNGTDTYVNIPGVTYAVFGLLVNNSGNVSGDYNANLGGNPNWGFFWNSASSSMSVFPGIYSDTDVSDMNNLNEVVGSFRNTYGFRQGFTWRNGVLTPFDIHDYLPTVQYNGQTYSANYGVFEEVNDQGQILGGFSANYGAGPGFWFIASPPGVPEPSTLTLVGLGFFGLARVWRASAKRR